MSNQLSDLLELAISLPVTASFRQQANFYASQFFTTSTRQRMYFHTLAVLVADVYLRLLGFETNMTKLERWNAIYRLWSEGNEIELLGLGNLECCLISSEQQSVVLPSEIESNLPLIGYLFIEIDRSEKVGTLIGFLPAVHPEVVELEVEIATLKSMDDLIDYLLKEETSSSNQTDKIRSFNLEFPEGITITYLRNWLNNIYENDWQPARRSLRNPPYYKKLKLAEHIFILELSIANKTSELLSVSVIVKCENNTPLPLGMQVTVQDEFDTDIQIIKDRCDLIPIYMEFSIGEKFWVELRLGGAFIQEYFII